MQGQKQFIDQEVTRFRLSQRVPAHNFYRRLADLVDWGFLYEETQALYSHTGQPSLDPVVFFKLVLVEPPLDRIGSSLRALADPNQPKRGSLSPLSPEMPSAAHPATEAFRLLGRAPAGRVDSPLKATQSRQAS